MSQSDVAEVIAKILENSDVILSDLEKCLIDFSDYESLSKEELNALKVIDTKQVENFLKDSNIRRVNSLYNINHG